jgi:Leucine-rich repeat (LRR) protein
VIHQDLRFFTRLTFLDVSDNCLRLEHFCELPALRDLRLPCNGISEVPSLQGLGFGKLRCLDLSYNSLSVNAILPLASLPTLRELDLSGNTMQVLRCAYADT